MLLQALSLPPPALRGASPRPSATTRPGEFAFAPKSPPCAPGRSLGGSSEAVPSADGRSVYVLASLPSILPGAVTAFAVSP